MKWHQNIWFYVWALTLAFGVALGVLAYDEGYDAGYSWGYSDTPHNVIEIASIEITREDGLYHFTVVSGNTTLSVAELPVGKAYIGVDPTPLEQVISRELDATDSYDIVFRHKRESLNVISFTITGKATPNYMGFRNFD